MGNAGAELANLPGPVLHGIPQDVTHFVLHAARVPFRSPLQLVRGVTMSFSFCERGGRAPRGVAYETGAAIEAGERRCTPKPRKMIPGFSVPRSGQSPVSSSSFSWPLRRRLSLDIEQRRACSWAHDSPRGRRARRTDPQSPSSRTAFRRSRAAPKFSHPRV